MHIKKAENTHYDNIIKLQNKYKLKSNNLTDKQKGFLVSNLDHQMLEKYNNDGGVFIAIEDNEIIGFLCLGEIKHYPNQLNIIEGFINGLNKPRNYYNPLVTGPVCIDSNYRGKGILKALYLEAYKNILGKYNLIIGFIDYENQATINSNLNVKVEGLKQLPIGSFTYKGNKFCCIMTEIPNITSTL